LLDSEQARRSPLKDDLVIPPGESGESALRRIVQRNHAPVRKINSNLEEKYRRRNNIDRQNEIVRAPG
jgi:hypothetical protein